MKRRGITTALVMAFAVGLAAPAHAELVLSPDGRNAYVTHSEGSVGAVTELARDPSSGALRPLGAQELRDPGVMAMAPDGKALYVVEANLFLPKPPGIVVFDRDPNTGRLSRRGELPFGVYRRPSDLAVSKDGRHVYLSDPWNDELVIYGRAATNELTPKGQMDLPGGGSAIALSGDGTRLYLGAHDGVFTLRRAPDGMLTQEAATGCSASCRGDVIVLSSDEERLIAGPEGPTVYSRGTEAGTWTAGAPSEIVGNHEGSRRSLVTAEGDLVYVADQRKRTLHVMRTTETGVELLHSYRSQAPDGTIAFDGPGAIVLSPGGRQLYVEGFGGSVTVFARDSVTGSLTLSSRYTPPPPPGQGFPDLEISINGGDLYTNDRDVLVTVNDVPFSLVSSNDGGFRSKRAVELDEKRRYRWRLATTGPERLPKTVYARTEVPIFAGQTARDDIVLDEVRPVVSSTKRVIRHRSPRVRVGARDRISGVRALQVSASRRHPGRWRRYSRRASYPVRRGKAWVRVRDRAGNRSKWRLIKPRKARR